MEWHCDLCDQTGFGRVSTYTNKVFFCQSCRQIHWDGVGPVYEERFIIALEKAGVSLPSRNDKGWFPLI